MRQLVELSRARRASATSDSKSSNGANSATATSSLVAGHESDIRRAENPVLYQSVRFGPQVWFTGFSSVGQIALNSLGHRGGCQCLTRNAYAMSSKGLFSVG